MSMDQHGGNIYRMAKELGIREEEVLDFSANINPLGIPDRVKKAMIEAVEGTVNYPDPDSTELVDAIAENDGVPPEYIVCGNGGADMLYRLAYGLRPGNVVLPVPSFVEYEEALRAGGAGIRYYNMEKDLKIREDLLEMITPGTDLVVICNPNNPTGILTEKELVIRILEKAGQNGCRVLVDECFLDICEDGERFSIIPEAADYQNAIILKSFTKLFAIPGLRLGYTICSDPVINEKLVHAGQAWPVNYIAQKAGTAALKDKSCRDEVVRTVSEELAYMKAELSGLPVQLYDGCANYLFFRAPGIRDLDQRLQRYGILIRNCSNYRNLGPDYWRVAVKTHEENEVLLKRLREVMGPIA